MLITLGAKAEIAIPSILRIYLNEPEPTVKLALHGTLLSFGPAIIAPCVEILDEVIRGSAEGLVLVLHGLASERLEKLSQSAERLGDEAWERIRVHWQPFVAAIRQLLDCRLDIEGELGDTLELLLIALRPASLPVLQGYVEATMEPDKRRRVFHIISRCGAQGGRYLERLFASANDELRLDAASHLASTESGLARLMQLSENGPTEQEESVIVILSGQKPQRVVRYLPRLYRWLRGGNKYLRDYSRHIFGELLEENEQLWEQARPHFPSVDELLVHLGTADDSPENSLLSTGLLLETPAEILIVLAMLIPQLQNYTGGRELIREMIDFRVLSIEDEETREGVRVLLQQL